MEKIDLTRASLPSGFSLALSQNPEALNYFSLLPDEMKKSVIEKSRTLNSLVEMKNYINELTN